MNILDTMVQKRIYTAVQSAGPFALLADENKDISKTERLTFVLRYVDISCGGIHEHLIKFGPTTSFSSESLSTSLFAPQFEST